VLELRVGLWRVRVLKTVKIPLRFGLSERADFVM
jgi:hypothetical protein